jgi:hypothetical protein
MRTSVKKLTRLLIILTVFKGGDMSDKKPDKKELERLVEQINQDQKKEASAEKRVKVNTSFKKAVKKMGQTPPPKKENE